ncbi:MAG: hypothetical protein Q9182_003414 [Xanthomendoza sp. 2 TL-2023]
MDNPTKVKACWETTSRLLANVVNEGLVKACIVPVETDNSLQIRIEARDESKAQAQHFILVRVHNGCKYDERTLLAQAPLQTIQPEALSDVQKPKVVFISVSRDLMSTVGRLDELLGPLILENEFCVAYNHTMDGSHWARSLKNTGQRLTFGNMTFANELAAATGSDANFDKAKHCSVLVRENLEEKARANGETLIVSAALAEKGVIGEVCHAEQLFELCTEAQKEIWFRHGVSLEAHGQNILSRFHVASKRLVGFAYRDFGGLKLHTPTLSVHGFEVKSPPPGSLILTDNVVELWENCHHTIFQSHLNQFIQALGSRKERAWAIVRQELDKELNPRETERAKPLYDFLMQESVPYKCFLRMKMQGPYRDQPSFPQYDQIFLSDHEKAADELSIKPIDGSGTYEPSSVRFGFSI